MVAVTPSIRFNSVAVAEILVPPISNVVTESSPATVINDDAGVELPTIVKYVSS